MSMYMTTQKIKIFAMTISVILGSIFSGQAVLADVGSATIQGMIERPDIQQVQIQNVDNGYLITVSVGPDGGYSVSGLAPGRYRLLSEVAGGEKTSDIVELRLGQVAVIDIENETDEHSIEELVVTAERIETDGFSSEIGTSLSPDLIGRLPQGNRNFLSFADLAPGVVSSPDANGNIQFRGGAQRASEVNVFIDGVSQKDFVLASGITGQDSSRGNPFPQSAVAEYKVISSNYKAEFDQIGSASIVAVTKRGGNEHHGGTFFDFTDTDLRSRTPNESPPGAEKAETEQQQYGFWFSGPLLEDKLHYYVSYERKDNSDLRELVPGGPVSVRDNFPQNVRDGIAQAGTFTSEFEQDLFLVKLNWNINENHHLEFSYRDRSETELSNVGGLNSFERAVNGNVDETRIKLTHEYRGDFIFNQLSFTHEEAARNPTPVNNTVGENYSLANVRNGTEAIINLGGARDFQDKGQKGWGIQNDLTLSGIQFAGDHTFKMGFKFKQLDLNGVEINPFNQTVFFSFDVTEFDFENDATTILNAVPYRVEFTRPVSPDTPFVTSENSRFGIYFQDEWAVSDRLILNVGLRWDYEDTPLYTDFRTPDDVVTALRENPDINNPNAGYDMSDFISNGSERDNFEDAWQPRLGFTYTLTESGNHRLFGGYGRSYNRVQFDLLQLEATRTLFSRFNVNFSGDHQFDCNDPCIAFDPGFLEPGSAAVLPVRGAREVFAIDNNLKTPFSDQFSLGIRSIWGEWHTELGYNRVESKDGFAFVLGNRREGGLFYPEGFIFSRPPFGVNISPKFSNLLLGTNGLATNSDSFYLKLEKPKRSSKWSANITYTYTDAEENVQFGGPFEALDPPPGAFGFFPAAGVSDHIIVAAFTYDLPWDIQFSSKLNLRSGEPFYGQQCDSFGPDVCRPVQGILPREDFIFNDAFAFRQVDISLARNFNLGQNRGGVYIRADVLNMLDYENFAPGGNRFIGSDGNPDFGRTEGNIQGLPRTVKLSAGYNF